MLLEKLGRLVALTAVFAVPNIAGADFVEQKKITASDAGGWFKGSVSISGNTAIVGVEVDDGTTAPGQGSAYIFKRNKGGNNWGKMKKLTASDGGEGDKFGESVSVSGDTAVVGAPEHKVSGIRSGAAYIFKRKKGGANNWGEIKKLTASDGTESDPYFGDYFGGNVSISEDTVIIGAHGNDDLGADSGAAYIFQRNHGGRNNGGEVKKLTPSDGTAYDFFGRSVSISGDTAIVGASGNIFTPDVAYVFERNHGGVNNWGEVKKLTASDSIRSNHFGDSVSISGDTVIIGAWGDRAAYIFERNQGGANNWGQVKKLTVSDNTHLNMFGTAVSISGDTAVVGAYGSDDNGTDSGSA